MLAALSSTEGYTPTDRYRDFRRVFMSSDEGKRVLREILGWCHLLRPSVMALPIDTGHVLLREGERNIGLKLLATVNTDPPQQPTKATKTRKHRGAS